MSSNKEDTVCNDDATIPTSKELLQFIDNFYDSYRRNKIVEPHEIIEDESEEDNELMPKAQERKSSKLVRTAWLGEEDETIGGSDESDVENVISALKLTNRISRKSSSRKSSSQKHTSVENNSSNACADNSSVSSEEFHRIKIGKSFNIVEEESNDGSENEHASEEDLTSDEHVSQESEFAVNETFQPNYETSQSITTNKRRKVDESDSEKDNQEMPYHSSFEKDTNDYVEPNEVNLLSCVQIVDGADQPADSEERDFRKLIMEERLFMKKKMEEHYKRLKFFKSKMLEEMHFIEEMSDNYSKTQHEFDSSTEEMTKEKDCCTKFVENKTKSSERNSKETSNSCVPQGNDQKKKQVLNAAQLRKEALTPRDLSTNFSQLDSVETGHKDERTESESADSEEKLVIGSERYEDMNQTYEQLDLRLERDRNQPTFMDAALESADRKKLKEYCLLPRQYSQSTLRKHNWVLRLYDYFAKDLDFKPFPIEIECIRGFLRFLCKDCHYSVGSVQSVVVPSLKRIQTKMFNEQIDQKLNDGINSVVSELRRNKSLKQKGDGKEPLVTFDVKYLINSIPDYSEFKAEDASLFLFALHTGSRAVTCGGIRLCDIRNVIIEEDGTIFVKIRQMRTKGKDNWNHVVTLENQNEEDVDLDAVYWMRKHILNKFKMDLFEKDKWPVEDERSDLIWTRNTEVMRTRLKKRLDQSGFPSESFGFHSLRSGFLCSALMNAGSNKEERNSILETCAMVAGWIPFSYSQMAYIKKTASQTVIASRVIIVNKNKPRKALIDDRLLKIESFHGFKLKSQSWNREIIFSKFNREIVNRMKLLREGKKNDQRTNEYLFRKGLGKFAEENEELEEKAKEKYLPKLEKASPSSYCSIKEHIRAEIARKDIINILLLDPTCVNQHVEIFLDFMKKENLIERDIKKYNCKKIKENRNRMIMEKREKDYLGKRIRKRWSKDEDEILKEHKAKEESWVKIASFLENRTAGDCSDRWRNIKKKQERKKLNI